MLIQKFISLGLANKQAVELASIFSTKIHLNKNDYWLNKNSVCTELGFIIKGMCRYYYINDNGIEVTRWVSVKNEFATSLSSFIRQIRIHEYIQAIKPTKIVVAKKKDWEKFYEKNKYARFFWKEAIENYLIEIESRVYSLIVLNAKNRYRQLKQNYPHLVREVPDKYIASIIGIKPRHLSRIRASSK